MVESIYTPEYVPHFALFHATLTYVVKGKYTTARRSGLGPRPLGRADGLRSLCLCTRMSEMQKQYSLSLKLGLRELPFILERTGLSVCCSCCLLVLRRCCVA